MTQVQIIHDDFFSVNWSTIFSLLSEPILVIGNPPWVTNAELTTLHSQNLPQKNNFQQLNGLTAMTDTQTIRRVTPQTWNYLNSYVTLLDQRKSAVYKKQPRFAIFGVGDYSFTHWKVAISGLYKKLHFALVGPYAEKPIVLDDTCYLLPCTSKDEAVLIYNLLCSEIAQQFFTALIFWDAKRPITIDILNQLDLTALARELGLFEQLQQVANFSSFIEAPASQLSLFA